MLATGSLLLIHTHSHTHLCCHMFTQTHVWCKHAHAHGTHRNTHIGWHVFTHPHSFCVVCIIPTHSYVIHTHILTGMQNFSFSMPGTKNLLSSWLLLDVPVNSDQGHLWDARKGPIKRWIREPLFFGLCMNLPFLGVSIVLGRFVTHQMARAATVGWLSLCQTSSVTTGSISFVTVFT